MAICWSNILARGRIFKIMLLTHDRKEGRIAVRISPDPLREKESRRYEYTHADCKGFLDETDCINTDVFRKFLNIALRRNKG